MRTVAVAVLLTLLPACAGRDSIELRPAPTDPPTTATSTTVGTTTTTTVVPSTTTTGAPRPNTTRRATTTTVPAPPPAVIDIPYRVEVRTTDAATANFGEVVDATLGDGRGWQRAAFRIFRRDDAPYLIVIAEGDEVDRLCLPYDTYGRYSCQNGPVVAVNADRWRSSDPKFTGDLATYRQMLVNHEVGHLLGQKHPKPQCPRRGEPAPVMNQQSTELNGCLPNPWPLDWEVALAARHDRKIAPYKGE